MDNTVVQLRELGIVPSSCGANEIACDSLELVDVPAVAVRTFLKVFIGILVAAVHTAVSVVVYGTVAYIVSVHKVYYSHDSLRVVCGVTVDFHIEDMSSTGKIVVRSLYLSLVLRCTFVVYGDVVGVGIVFLVRNSRKDTEFLPVKSGESS